MTAQQRRIEVIEALKSFRQLEAHLKIMESRLEVAREKVSIIQKAMSCLNEDERIVITKMLIDGESQIDVSDVLNIEKTHVYRKRDIALGKIAMALFGDQRGCLSEKGGEEE